VTAEAFFTEVFFASLEADYGRATPRTPPASAVSSDLWGIPLPPSLARFVDHLAGPWRVSSRTSRHSADVASARAMRLRRRHSFTPATIATTTIAATMTRSVFPAIFRTLSICLPKMYAQ
jgi:hypothetical protein